MIKPLTLASTISILVCLTLGEVATAVPNEKRHDALAVITKALSLKSGTDYDAAYNYLDTLLKRDPKDGAAIAAYGLLKNEQGKFLECRDYLNKAISLHNSGQPLSTIQQLYIVRAFANAALKNKKEALADVEKARLINDKNGEVYHIRGKIKTAFGDYKDAIPDLEKGLQAAPRDSMFTLAHNNEKISQFNKAREWLDKLCSAYPTAQNLAERRRFCFNRGDFNQAAEDARRCLELNPEDKQMRLAYIVALYTLGRNKEAGAAAQQALARNPNDDDVLRWKLKADIALGRGKEPLAAVTQLLKKHPSDPELIELHAMTLRNLTRYEEAIAEFQKASRYREPDSRALLSRAHCYQLSEQYALAAEDLAKLYQLTLNRDLIVEAGQCWVSRGDYKRAIDTLAIAIDPKSPGKPLSNTSLRNLYTSQAHAQLRLKNYEQARESATKALSLNPNHTAAYSVRADANAKLGKVDDAIADWSQAIKRRRDFTYAYAERAKLYDLKKMPELAQKDREKMKTLSKGLENDMFPSVDRFRD